MKLNYRSIKRQLKGLNYNSYSDLDEYQNKFYLMEKIRSALPAFSEEIIYKAIDNTTDKLKVKNLSANYIAVLSNELSSFLIKK